MQRAVGLESTVVEAIQGLLIIFVAASLAFRCSKANWSVPSPLGSSASTRNWY